MPHFLRQKPPKCVAGFQLNTASAVAFEFTPFFTNILASSTLFALQVHGAGALSLRVTKILARLSVDDHSAIEQLPLLDAHSKEIR